jgi:hypothetical protein
VDVDVLLVRQPFGKSAGHASAMRERGAKLKPRRSGLPWIT